MNKFSLLAALALATQVQASPVYLVPFDCLGSHTSGVSMTNITDTTTLGDYNLGADVVVDKGYYCYHQFLYEFEISWTVPSGDDASIYFVEYVPMVVDNYDSCGATDLWWVYSLSDITALSSGTSLSTYGDLTAKDLKSITDFSDYPCGYYVYIYYGNTGAESSATFTILFTEAQMLGMAAIAMLGASVMSMLM